MNIFNTLNEDNIESISKSYSEEFSYTNNSITYYQNDLYDIILFKNSSCLVELSIKISNMDYANCFNKIKNIHKINQDVLVKMIIEKHDITDKNNREKSYLFFDPYTKEIINPSIICPNETITINENLLSYYDENSTNFGLVNYLLDQNINIFDPNDDFYTNLCLYLETPIKKDIPIKDRLIEFYPNITLCDQGCKYIGVNFTIKAAICECTYNDILNNEKANNAFMEDEISNINKFVIKSNIEVLKCYKYIFKYFTKSYGGFIVSGLFFLCFSFTNAFFYSGFSKIKIYIFDLLQNYISTISKSLSNNIMNPPRNIRQSQGDENGRKKGKTEIGKRGNSKSTKEKRQKLIKKEK